MNRFVAKLMPLVAIGILCGLALAGGGKDEHIRSIDTDGDGRISALEYAEGAALTFTRMDVDHDSRVTATEMQAQLATLDHGGKDDSPASSDTQPAAVKKIAMMDSNGDGTLTAKELATGEQQTFDELDGDHDGSLTAREMHEGERPSLSAIDE